jgi:hypothetical protein
MKRIAALFVLSLALLVGSFPLHAYDDSASQIKILPECIWALATGGGTWVTEVQITNAGSVAATVDVFFMYQGAGSSYRGPFTLITGLASNNTVKFNNILQTIDTLDTAHSDYYGKVGAVWFETAGVTSAIHVTAKTVNGKFGKTFPGLVDSAANTAAVGRPMMIPLLVNNTTYRTFTGIFNTSSSATYTATFYLTGPDYIYIGNAFTKTLLPFEYMSFNPFVEAGIPAGIYDNHWLLIVPTAGGSSIRGIMCYGAIANNISNDPAALIAKPWNTEAYPALPMQAPQ